MSWNWTYETSNGTVVGRSENFDTRGEAETWVGESFGDLLEDGVDQVRLYENEVEIFGPMSLHPDS